MLNQIQPVRKDFYEFDLDDEESSRDSVETKATVRPNKLIVSTNFLLNIFKITPPSLL